MIDIKNSITGLNYEHDFARKQSIAEYDTQYIWDRKTIINGEQQYYPDGSHPDAIPFSFKNDALVIAAGLTPPHLMAEFHNKPYYSGVLTSRTNGYSQMYGFWEINAKLPSARGAWPAFWLLPTFKQWPGGIAVLPEIDIMEAIGEAFGVYHASHHTNQSGKLVSDGSSVETGIDLTTTYNRYGLFWDKHWLIWTFNGVEVKRRATPADMVDEPRHYLMNLAVGGNWPQKPVAEDYPSKAEFCIKWVRVYGVNGLVEIDDSEPDTVAEKPSADNKLIAPGFINSAIIAQHGLDGDTVFKLDNGEFVTKRDIGKMTRYLMEMNAAL